MRKGCTADTGCEEGVGSDAERDEENPGCEAHAGCENADMGNADANPAHSSSVRVSHRNAMLRKYTFTGEFTGFVVLRRTNMGSPLLTPNFQ
jgi:hypothetical protein